MTRRRKMDPERKAFVNAQKVLSSSKYTKISVRILFPFVLTGIITERKDNWQENIQTLIKEHIDLKRCE